MNLIYIILSFNLISTRFRKILYIYLQLKKLNKNIFLDEFYNILEKKFITRKLNRGCIKDIP